MVCLSILSYLATMGTCLAANSSPSPLSEQRWQEAVHGISILPPADTIEHPWPDPTSRTSFHDQSGYSISLSIRRRRTDRPQDHQPTILISPLEQIATDRYHFEIHTGTDKITLERVEEIAITAMEVRDATCVLRDRADLDPRGVPATALYFRIAKPRIALTTQDKTTPPWILGFAFAPLHDETFVVFELRADETQYAHVRPIFEAVVNSLEVESFAALSQRRRTMIERGDLWVQMLHAEQVRHHLRPVQWFRLQRNGSDIGWMRIREHDTEEMGMQGIGIQTDTHLVNGDRTFDGVEQCFASYDGKHEIWSRRMTVRPAGVAPGTSRTATITTMNETGTRSNQSIQVNRKGPKGIRTLAWSCPEKAYLSQVTARIMRRMLPHKTAHDMAFYAYHPNTMSVLLRTVHVQPDGQGAYAVTTRPGPDHPDDMTYFDAEGEFLRRDMHAGLALVATDEPELRQLWNLPPP